MELVYLAGAYTDKNPWKVKENVLQAEKYSVLLLRKGYAVFTPHKIWPTYDGYNFTWDDWMEVGLEILKRCDSIAMVPNWKDSKGATIEHERALEWGKKVIYL